MEGQEREDLLENVNVSITDVNGSQYMIQRMDANHQLLSSELLQHHNGLVVDLGAGDFIPVNYTSDDLHDLTEEDRNLAAALVAVQLSQQQKQQQQHHHLHADGTGGGGTITTQGAKVIVNGQQLMLQDKHGNSYLEIVDNDTIEAKLIDGSEFTQQIYDSAELITDGTTETIIHSSAVHSVQDSEDDESSSMRNVPVLKKSLPHKKRISRRLNRNKIGGEKSAMGTTTTTRSKLLHSCSECEQVFTSFEEYNEHQSCCGSATTVAPASVSANMFCCQICNADFTGQLEFFSHLKAHYEPLVQVEEVESPDQINDLGPVKEEEEPSSKDTNILQSLLTLTCIECNKTFRKQKTYEAHLKEYHNKPEPLNEFSEPEDLMAGIEVDNSIVDDHVEEEDIDDVDDCEDNKIWFQGEEDLQATEEDLKEIEATEHVCHLCAQPFPIRAILMQHLITCRETNSHLVNDVPLHLPENVPKKKPKKKAELRCTECDRTFTHRNSLVYHMRSHTGHRPHQCDQCGKSFFAASALKVHMRLHSGDKPYKCNDCMRTFRQWGDLKYHCISIHSDTKQYQCEYCGKDFARKYSLIVHRRIHTGEKNYRCEFCNKTFRASSYLQNHRRIHTGEKPHECVYCHKRFRVRSDMKRHVRTHSIKKAPGRSLTAIAQDEYPAILTTKKALEEGTDALSSIAPMRLSGAQPKIKQLIESDSEQDEEDDVTAEEAAAVAGIELKDDDSDSAVASLQYTTEDGLEMETVQDGNTLYVMPISSHKIGVVFEAM